MSDERTINRGCVERFFSRVEGLMTQGPAWLERIHSAARGACSCGQPCHDQAMAQLVRGVPYRTVRSRALDSIGHESGEHEQLALFDLPGRPMVADVA